MGFMAASMLFCYQLGWDQMLGYAFVMMCVAAANMIFQAHIAEQKQKKGSQSTELPPGTCPTCKGRAGHSGEDCMANPVWFSCGDCAGTGKEIVAEKPMISSMKECPPHNWSMDITTGRYSCMKCPAKSGT